MRLVVLLVGIGALAASEGNSAPRPGKVVRVERRSKKLFGTPRYCAISIGDLQAYCYGKKPEINEKIAILDQHRTLGTVRVDTVEPLGACATAQSGLWLAHTVLDSGDLTTPNDSAVGGVIDVVIDPKVGARLVKVDRVPADRPLTVDQVIAIDADGDGGADLEFLAFACDDQNQPPTSTSPSTGQCLEVWSATGHSVEHLRTDRIAQNCF